MKKNNTPKITVDGFKKYSNDKKVELKIKNHYRKFNISPQSAVTHFPLYIRRQLFKRFIAHIELFRLSLDTLVVRAVNGGLS